jgi:hypothetical protein
MAFVKRVSFVAAFLATLLFTPASAFGQTLYGSMVGKVTDPSGAAIASATITINSKATGFTRETVSDSAGNWELLNIPSGTYEVKTSAPGFSSAVRSDVPVTINNISRIDSALQLGSVTETVLVSSQAQLLQTDRAEIREEVTTKELADLPVPPGRNYQQIFRSLPGFSPPENAHSIPSNPSRALQFSVNGASRSSNNTRLDGASTTNIQLPHVVSYVPALESIETVNVVTNSFDAEQGLAGGAAINVQIKSGTNNLHGSAFEYHTNQHLKATPFFTPADRVRPKLVYNQFGGTVGGAIKRDKLFYFVSYEGTFDRRNAELRVSVPTPAMKAGDFSASDQPIYDPLTGNDRGENRTPFANKQVPLERQDPIARKIIALIPDPNLPGLANNYYGSGGFLFDRHTVDSKVNWVPSPKLTAFVRFSVLHYDTLNQQIFGPALGGRPIGGGNPGSGYGGTYSSTIGATYVFTPSMVLDAYFGFSRQDTTSEQPRLDEKLGLDFLGIPGTNGSRAIEGGWPRFQISSFATLGVN